MNNCAKCHEPINRADGVVDHIVPISRGGSAHDGANIQVMHKSCHLSCKPSRFRRFIGKLLCAVGRHKWLPKKGTMRLDWRSKWEAYQVADGICQRCGNEAEIRRDYYW